ncbi:tagaturonate reductase [Pontibacter russatus]|uniref:tagaturonate reductase n=1 Tax=Pontibacter russatus TaxID=2694929 RepID=UPI00137B7646|nr:tagaturonate reductase [Pontibacter russatus]
MKPLNRETAGIKQQRPVKALQFGEGNFLRGFVDWMIDVLNERTNFNGAVDVVQPRDRSRRIIETLQQQDGLYHVLLKGIQGGKPTQQQRLITCLASALNPYDDYEAYLQRGENPDLRFIFSNTTEAGIIYDEHDTGPDAIPASFPGKLTAMLHRRFKHFGGAGEKGLIIIPTELIENNGDTLRHIVLRYADTWSLPQEFTDWVKEHVIFCNTLVDRIVPGFPQDTIEDVQQELGYKDQLVVTAEPYHLLVIEAPESVKQEFPAEEAGLQVKFVRDLTPYRTSKVRILNGAHTTLVPVAYLRGLRTVQEAVEDAQVGRFIREAIYEEVLPTLDRPGEELKQFAADVLERFRNPFIRHELLSISLNSISKYKVRVLPSVLAYIARRGQLPERLLHALAALILFYRGAWHGEKIPLNDSPEVLQFFEKAWQQGDIAAVAAAVLSNTEFWGIDLTQVPGLQANVVRQMEQSSKRL